MGPATPTTLRFRLTFRHVDRKAGARYPPEGRHRSPSRNRTLLASLQKAGGEVVQMVRRIASLERDIEDLEVRVRGEATFRLMHVLIRPRGDFERPIPEDLKPSGGSWTRMRATRTSFHREVHVVHHGKTIEDWTMDLSFESLPETKQAPLAKTTILGVEVKGSRDVTSPLEENKISGEGAALDSRASGISCIDDGALAVGLHTASAERTFQHRVNPRTREFEINFFLWNTPMVVVYPYVRE